MKKLTLEKAHGILKRFDSDMPDEFTVMSVAYCGEKRTYYVEWFDEAEKKVYDDGVADEDRAAENAYCFKPSSQYSAIWFNDAEDGSESVVTAILEPDDVKALSESNTKLVLMDRVTR